MNCKQKGGSGGRESNTDPRGRIEAEFRCGGGGGGGGHRRYGLMLITFYLKSIRHNKLPETVVDGSKMARKRRRVTTEMN